MIVKKKGVAHVKQDIDDWVQTNETSIRDTIQSGLLITNGTPNCLGNPNNFNALFYPDTYSALHKTTIGNKFDSAGSQGVPGDIRIPKTGEILYIKQQEIIFQNGLNNLLKMCFPLLGNYIHEFLVEEGTDYASATFYIRIVLNKDVEHKPSIVLKLNMGPAGPWNVCGIFGSLADPKTLINKYNGEDLTTLTEKIKIMNDILKDLIDFLKSEFGLTDAEVDIIIVIFKMFMKRAGDASIVNDNFNLRAPAAAGAAGAGAGAGAAGSHGGGGYKSKNIKKNRKVSKFSGGDPCDGNHGVIIMSDNINTYLSQDVLSAVEVCLLNCSHLSTLCNGTKAMYSNLILGTGSSNVKVGKTIQDVLDHGWKVVILNDEAKFESQSLEELLNKTMDFEISIEYSAHSANLIIIIIIVNGERLFLLMEEYLHNRDKTVPNSLADISIKKKINRI